MDRSTWRSHQKPSNSPHERGDGSDAAAMTAEGELSPRAWGWIGFGSDRRRRHQTLPTSVGMDRPDESLRVPRWHSPHERGDGSFVYRPVNGGVALSPRKWGWIARWGVLPRCHRTFLTGVGMDRPITGHLTSTTKLSPREWGWIEPILQHPRRDRHIPHGSGDGSWGWIEGGYAAEHSPATFPTSVGMDRPGCIGTAGFSDSPHGSGDGSAPPLAGLGGPTLSPLTWGRIIDEEDFPAPSSRPSRAILAAIAAFRRGQSKDRQTSPQDAFLGPGGRRVAPWARGRASSGLNLKTPFPFPLISGRMFSCSFRPM